MRDACRPHRTGLQKAAILLVLLGEEAATEIYKHLNESELQQNHRADCDARKRRAQDGRSDAARISPACTLTQESLAGGGPEVAAKMLSKAFGERRPRRCCEQVMLAREETGRNFDALQKADPQQLVKFVQGEHPQTIAMVLAHLGIKAAGSLLVLLPEKLRGQTIKRLAEMQQFSPEMAQKISLVLHRKVTESGRPGPAVLWRSENGG